MLDLGLWLICSHLRSPTIFLITSVNQLKISIVSWAAELPQEVLLYTAYAMNGKALKEMDICDVHKIMAGPVWPSATLPFTLVLLLAMLWMVATRCGFTTGDAIQLCTNTLWESLNKMFPHITSEANEVHHYWGGQWFSNPSNKNTDGKFVQQAAHHPFLLSSPDCFIVIHLLGLGARDWH